jgi:hypothetical protein
MLSGIRFGVEWQQYKATTLAGIPLSGNSIYIEWQQYKAMTLAGIPQVHVAVVLHSYQKLLEMFKLL